MDATPPDKSLQPLEPFGRWRKVCLPCNGNRHFGDNLQEREFHLREAKVSPPSETETAGAVESTARRLALAVPHSRATSLVRRWNNSYAAPLSGCCG